MVLADTPVWLSARARVSALCCQKRTPAAICRGSTTRLRYSVQSRAAEAWPGVTALTTAGRRRALPITPRTQAGRTFRRSAMAVAAAMAAGLLR